MKQMFAVFYYTLLRNVRDRSSLLEMLILPIVLIFILGSALGMAFAPQTITPTVVGYLNEDRGTVGSQFDEFLTNPEIQEVLKLVEVKSPEQGLSLLAQGQYSAFIHIREDFSEQALAGEAAVIHITGFPGSTLRVPIVENIVASFTNGANTVVALAQMGVDQPDYTYTGGGIEDRPISASGLMPGAIDYYAVTMLVMTIMYGTMYAANGMGDSYLAAMGRRIKTTPTGPAQQYVGLVLANLMTVCGQILIIFAFTRYVYGVNWGESPLLVLLIAGLLALVAIGLGTMVVMVTRDAIIASRVLTILVPITTFVAGGYIPIRFTGVLGKLQYLSPNHLAQTAIFNTIYGSSGTQTLAAVGSLALLVVLTFGAAMLAERRHAS